MTSSSLPVTGPLGLVASASVDRDDLDTWPSSLALAARASTRSAALGTLGGMALVAAVGGLGGLLG
ncbi:MAG: hypothetical protein M0P31_08990 [Solirubrobacteraceae bacterium]|nr:hypothetical protein [Solirubrobacteraceae bacterium]